MSLKGLNNPNGVKNRTRIKDIAPVLGKARFSGDAKRFLSDVCSSIAPFNGHMAVPHDVLRAHGIDPALYPLKGEVRNMELLNIILP